MDPAGEGNLGGRLWGKGCVWEFSARLPSFPTWSSWEQPCVESWMRLYPRQPDHLPLLPQGKVFPKLRKRSSIRSVDMEEMGMGRATDYVFRIIYPGHRHEHSECPELHPWGGEEDDWGGRERSITQEGSRQGPPTRPG